ncbi:MAG: hypothetical protein AAGG08_10770, partial [Actinomycetota bacterium]
HVRAIEHHIRPLNAAHQGHWTATFSLDTATVTTDTATVVADDGVVLTCDGAPILATPETP